MTNEELAGISLPVVFEPKNRNLLGAGFFIMGAGFFVLCVLAELRRVSPLTIAEILMFASSVLMMLFSLMMFCQYSDVIFDQQGLARRMFGWRWKSIRWIDISTIVVRPFSMLADGRRPNSMIFFTKDMPSISARFKSTVVPDVVSNLDELCVVLNYFVKKYGIKYEVMVRGKKVTINELDPEKMRDMLKWKW